MAQDSSKVSRPRRFRAWWVGVVCAALLLVSGCSWNDMGTAVRVGDQRLSVQQANDMLADPEFNRLASILGQGQASNREILFSVYGQNQQIVGFARSKNLTPNQGQVDSLVRQEQQAINEQLLSQPPEQALSAPAQDLVRWVVQTQVTGQTLTTAIQQDPSAMGMQDVEQLRQYLEAHPIVVNPRYGSINPETGQLTPLFSGGLSTASTPTASVTTPSAPQPQVPVQPSQGAPVQPDAGEPQQGAPAQPEPAVPTQPEQGTGAQPQPNTSGTPQR